MPTSTSQWMLLLGYVMLAYVLTRGSLVVLYELAGLILELLGTPPTD